ncbi:MAG: hypothetical protein FOGNACKC_00457 [Anaerolineae bacterium]|nr:hypothetical protein [Anaerolineae bacterium]
MKHRIFTFGILLLLLALPALSACKPAQSTAAGLETANTSSAAEISVSNSQPDNPALAGWQTVTGEHVSFRLPPAWRPTAVEPGMGSVLESWTLGIPGVETDQDISFFAAPLEQIQPTDSISEYPFIIGGRPGVKWVRAGAGYFSYDYYTGGGADAGSFGLHVTVADETPELEAELDMVASTISFITPGK